MYNLYLGFFDSPPSTMANEVPLSELTTPPNSEWLTLNVMSAHYTESPFGDAERRVSGKMAKTDFSAVGKFEVELFPFQFPDDVSEIYSIESALKYPYLYLHNSGDYPREIHSTGSAVSVVLTEYSQDQSDGQKIIKFTLEKSYLL